MPFPASRVVVLVRGLLCLALVLSGPASRLEGQSLGELAQKEKARREREKERKGRPQRVYTDEDLAGKAAPGSEEAAPQPPAAPPNPEAGSEGSSGSEAGNEPASEESSEEGDTGLNGRAAQARAALQGVQAQAAAVDAEVERLKSSLNPMSTTFKTDPYEILKLQGELTEAQARAAAARKEVEAAQKAMDDLVEEARRAGVRLPQ